jgi:uncharacterized protein (DUF302 family)
MAYFNSRQVDYSFEDALIKVTEELKKEGFGVLTEIDVKETLKKKLDVDFRKCKILGACNPPFAYKALQVEDSIGVLLPCNIVVQEKENGKVFVNMINPLESMEAVKNSKLEEIALQISTKLKTVLEVL